MVRTIVVNFFTACFLFLVKSVYFLKNSIIEFVNIDMMMYVFFKFNLDISLLFRSTVCEVMNWKRLAWCFIFCWNLTFTFFGMHKYADGKTTFSMTCFYIYKLIGYFISRGEMLGLRVCKSIANPVTNSKFATICHICTRANS